MVKTKVAFLGGPAFIQPTRAITKVSKSSDWLEKAGPPKSYICFDHVNRLIEKFRKLLP